MLISGNRTEWSPIRSVIIRVINKIGPPRSGSPICLIKTQEIRNFVLLAVKKISHLSARLMARTRADEELRRNCSPIGHNNTKHFLCPIRNQHSLDRLETVRWESVPRCFSSCAWKLSSRLFSRPDWPPLGLRGCWLNYPPAYFNLATCRGLMTLRSSFCFGITRNSCVI